MRGTILATFYSSTEGTISLPLSATLLVIVFYGGANIQNFFAISKCFFVVGTFFDTRHDGRGNTPKHVTLNLFQGHSFLIVTLNSFRGLCEMPKQVRHDRQKTTRC